MAAICLQTHYGLYNIHQVKVYLCLFFTAVALAQGLSDVSWSDDPSAWQNDERGSEDTGSEDAGSEDAGSEDAGSKDAGSEDAGSEDAGSKDAGSEDAGSENTGSEDAGSKDAGSEDVSSEDATSEDSSSEDTGSEDASSEDAGSEDAAMLNSGSLWFKRGSTWLAVTLTVGRCGPLSLSAFAFFSLGMSAMVQHRIRQT